MEQTNDNFDALWSNLKGAVATARTTGKNKIHQSVCKYREGSITVADKTNDDTALVMVFASNGSLSAWITPEACLELAAELIAKSMEIEEAKAEALSPSTQVAA